MWQEIAVGLVIAAAAILIGIRFWRNVSATKAGNACPSCDCSNCRENVTERGESGHESR